MQRINNTLTPNQAISIIDEAIVECKGNKILTDDLKQLKEWLRWKV